MNGSLTVGLNNHSIEHSRFHTLSLLHVALNAEGFANGTRRREGQSTLLNDKDFAGSLSWFR